MIIYSMIDADFNFDTIPFRGGFEAECEVNNFKIWLCYDGLGRTKKVAEGKFAPYSYVSSEQFNEQLRQVRFPDTTDSEGRVDVRTFIMMIDYAYRTALDLRLQRSFLDSLSHRMIIESDLIDANQWSFIDAITLEEKEAKK